MPIEIAHSLQYPGDLFDAGYDYALSGEYDTAKLAWAHAAASDPKLIDILRDVPSEEVKEAFDEFETGYKTGIVDHDLIAIEQEPN